MRIVGQNSDVHFGEVDEEEPDWRNELEEETDPDDEELEYTPQDVIDILGFDPKEFSEPDPTQNKDSSMSLNTIRAQMILETHSLTENVGKKGRSGRKKQANFKKEIGQMKSGKRKNLSSGAGLWLAKGHTNNAKSSKCPECGSKMKNGECPECEMTENAKGSKSMSYGTPGGAKKGWTDEARRKAALTLKAKSKVKALRKQMSDGDRKVYQTSEQGLKRIASGKPSRSKSTVESYKKEMNRLEAKVKRKVAGKNAHLKRVAAYQDAKKTRAKLASQSVKTMTETRKLLGLPDYLHKGGSSKAHQEVAKKALSTASSLTDPAAIKKYKDLAKTHKDLAKQFKAQDSPKKVPGKSGETAPKKKKVKRPLIDPRDRNLDPSTLIEGQNQTSTGRKGYYN